jgi:hypothetical protein
MTASQRHADALRTLARSEPLTDAQRAELVASGWADATPRQAQAELEEQARRPAASGYDHVRENLAAIHRTRCEIELSAAQRRYDEATQALEIARAKGAWHQSRAASRLTKATANLQAAQQRLQGAR